MPKLMHGQAAGVGTPTYRVWQEMRARCSNPSREHFIRYGGRGVKVCDRWRSFTNFLADMGVRPDGATLDRINNDGHYEPGNCRWATRKQNSRNTSRNHFLAHDGQTKSVAEWCEVTGLSKATVFGRIRMGWGAERVLTAPKRARSPNADKEVSS